MFSSRKSPIEAKIMRFLFKNPTFKPKSHIFSSENPHFIEYQLFYL
ncbi:hypothetical protein CP8484711_2811 [Chlamydia psittaci 84-8471/1]|nr:hypothetical protein CP8484711_2811 [Chlamydia psittaci 84-8471/1]